MLMTGVPQTMNRLRQEFGVKIGSSTGYTSEIMEKLRVGWQYWNDFNRFIFTNISPQPLAAAEGYTPDSYVTSDLVTTGRPAPSMIYLNMVNMDVFPAQVTAKLSMSICRGEIEKILLQFVMLSHIFWCKGSSSYISFISQFHLFIMKQGDFSNIWVLEVWIMFSGRSEV